MFLRKTVKRHNGRSYTTYLLVESVRTPQGPRQRTICSLGDLSPGPRQKWLGLVNRVEAALQGQVSLDGPDPLVEGIVDKIHSAEPRLRQDDDIVAVHADQASLEKAREAGPVHVGHQMWRRLGLGEILKHSGLSARARLLSEVMVLNRLVAPCSEHAMPGWIERTALSDILSIDLSELSDESLYRNLDRLHPNRQGMESALAEREKSLFNLDDTYYLYDLTSTYFEGQCLLNPKAQRGYSRDQRPDCKQVVVGLVLDRDGFPKAHEVFSGNCQDRASLGHMLSQLEQRSGRQGGATVIVDRGMAYEENLAQIRARGHHYLVASRQSERQAWFDELEDEQGWRELIRQPSPRNPGQKKSRVWIKRAETVEHLYVLCRSEGRKAKDQAIRLKQEKRLLADLARLRKRIDTGRLKRPEKVHEALGRLKERYPRVARYWLMSYDEDPPKLDWHEDTDKKQRALRLDGTYLLKTDRKDLSAEEAWRLYILLTRVEDAFRDMKSPLSERPIFHHLQHRVETHIFLCVLAYHLLVAVEKSFLDQGIHTSWATLREQLRTHQVVTAVLPTTNGHLLKIRRATTPEPQHRLIYQVLGIPEEVMAPVKTWLTAEEVALPV
ncbi:MAG TPA: IS1634 family transposase [Thermoanaerobaculia bacterium]|nr:IS1634 family transposase [Thermoanaerobaculia bacterium]